MRRDGAWMDWASEFCAELERDEALEVEDNTEWFDCEEWPPPEDERHEEDVRTPQIHGDSISSTTPPFRGRAEQQTLTEISIGEPEVPLQEKTSVGWSRAGAQAAETRESVTAAANECFLCGEVGCDCEASRPWRSVWCAITRRCEANEGTRRTQKITTMVSVGLTGMAKTRAVQEERRQKLQKKKQESKARRCRLDWQDISWCVRQEEQKREWDNRQRAIRQLHRAAVLFYLDVVKSEQEVRLADKYRAVRKLDEATKKKGGRRSKNANKKAKSKKQRTSSESKHKAESRHMAVVQRSQNQKASNASPTRYEKQADVIRSREPKIPW